jgi:hypothetical protein
LIEFSFLVSSKSKRGRPDHGERLNRGFKKAGNGTMGTHAGLVSHTGLVATFPGMDRSFSIHLGGNLRLIFIVTLAAIAGVLMTVAATPSDEAVTVGQSWLSLLDNQKYAESWKQAGSVFRDQVRQEQWIDALKKSRGPLGSLVSRTASRVQLTTSLRGAPDGEYAIIHFATSLRNKDITERLTLVKEDGRWQVAAFAIH